MEFSPAVTMEFCLTLRKKEREKINEKIDEFSLLEKQNEASIYRYQFELGEKQEKVLTIDSFKESIIKLKVNHESMSEKDLKTWLDTNVKEIIYDEGRFDIRFKLLDI